jgi:hypothetical protein
MQEITGFTVITGASQGLGRALAIESARRGENLILLSLPGEELCTFSRELHLRHQVSVLPYETDLTQPEAARQFHTWVKSQPIQVKTLINNAGIGGTASFERAPADYIDNIILLNIRALAMLTHLFIPELRQQKGARILNISSLAAFSPIPFKTVYPASKAFVYSFSLGLHEELRDTSVRVSVLHPGPMKTTVENTERLERHGLWAKMSTLTVEEVAEIAIRDMRRGKPVIIPGMLNKISCRMMKMVPSALKMRVLGRIFTKELNLKHAK